MKNKKDYAVVWKILPLTAFLWVLFALLSFFCIAFMCIDIPVWGKVLSAVVLISLTCSTVIVNSMRIKIDKNGMIVYFMGRAKSTYTWSEITDIKADCLITGHSFHTHYKFGFKTKDVKFSVFNTKRFAKLLLEYSKGCKSFQMMLNGILPFVGIDNR